MWWMIIGFVVIVGVIVAMVLFARRVAHFTSVTRQDTGDDDGQRHQ